MAEAAQFVDEIKCRSFNGMKRWKKWLVLFCHFDARLHSLPGHQRLKRRLVSEKLALEMNSFVAAIGEEREHLRRQREALESLKEILRRRLTLWTNRLESWDEDDLGGGGGEGGGGGGGGGVENRTVANARNALREAESEHLETRIRTVGDLLKTISSLESANAESSVWNEIESNWSVVSFFQEKDRIASMLHGAIEQRQRNDEKRNEINTKMSLLGKVDTANELHGYL